MMFWLLWVITELIRPVRASTSAQVIESMGQFYGDTIKVMMGGCTKRHGSICRCDLCVGVPTAKEPCGCNFCVGAPTAKEPRTYEEYYGQQPSDPEWWEQF